METLNQIRGHPTLNWEVPLIHHLPMELNSMINNMGNNMDAMDHLILEDTVVTGCELVA